MSGDLPSGAKRVARRLLPERWYDDLALVRARWATRHPQTFNEKVRYKVLRDRRALIGRFADKVAVREYVQRASVCDLTEVYAIARDLDELRRDDLPREFVVKASHTSGGVVVVWEGADPCAMLPEPSGRFERVAVHPDSLVWNDLVVLSRSWVAARFDGGPYQEWAYSQVPPRLLVEEVLRDATGALPADVKLWTYHGVCRVVEIAVGEFGRRRELLFLPDWTPLPDLPGDEELAASISRPQHLDEMLHAASVLGAETDFVRVDLYDCGDRIVFGELTNYPDAGRTPFVDPTLDARLAVWWTVPSRYR